MDAELERFKTEINLTEFAASLGYLIARGSTQSSVVMKHPTSDDKIIVRRDRDRHWTYFSVRDDSDNGTVIDFLQRRGSLRSLGAVRKELRAWLGVERPPLPPKLFRSCMEPHSGDLESVAAEYSRATHTSTIRYLHGRGIRPETLSSERFAEQIRVDVRGNVLFPHRDLDQPDRLMGFEKKNRGFSSFATGGTKTLWVSQTLPDDDRLVVVEGAIDALSYHQLAPRPHTQYGSTGGGFGPRTFDAIQRVVARLSAGGRVIIAVDNDAGGQKLGKQIELAVAGVPTEFHLSPIGKDWNDCLQARERDYIRSLRWERERGLGR